MTQPVTDATDIGTETRPSVESLLEAWGGQVALLTPTGRISWVSRGWDVEMRNFGLSGLRVGNDYWHALHAAIDTHTDRIDALIHAIEQVRSRAQSQIALEMSWSTPSGSRHVRVDVIALAQGFIVLQMRDISPSHQPSSDLVYMAYHDPVTGLPNRFAASTGINQALRRCLRTSMGMGLVFCDLDDFKNVNDRFGHLVGDALLQQIAQRWREWTRETDTLARISGDEFVLIADGVTGATELAGLAHRLAAALAQPMVVNSHGISITATYGAVFVEPARAPLISERAVLDAADHALYAAKRKGRDSLVVDVIGAAPAP